MVDALIALIAGAAVSWWAYLVLAPMVSRKHRYEPVVIRADERINQRRWRD